MDWKKIAPWNWFEKEEASVPVRAEVLPDAWSALRAEMERLFDERFARSFPGLAAGGDLLREGDTPLLRPSVDISEGKKAYTVRAELPGVESDDVALEVEGRTLVIRGEKRRESEEDEEGYHCVERSYGLVQRVLSLPDDADVEGIEARSKNGVLEVRIPKHEARASSARSVKIQRG